MHANFKQKLKIILPITFILMPLYAFAEDITNEQYYIYFQKIMNDKAIIYNSLNLSESQRQKYEEITNKYTPLYKDKIKEIITENSKPYPNRNILKKTEKDIYKTSQKENNELKSILNKIQCSKYRQIKHLERHDLKKEQHPKNYYKLNPQMTHFGGK